MNMMHARGFTLIELLVVISIIGVLATTTFVALSGARAKGRDARRATDIEALKKSIELHFNQNNNYIAASGGANDCAGSATLDTALADLVASRYLGRIPHDPTYPNNPEPLCYQYITDHSCQNGDGPHPYVLVFGTERTTFNFPSWNNEERRYCVTP